MPRLHDRTIAARGVAALAEVAASAEVTYIGTNSRQHVMQFLRDLGFEPAIVTSAELDPRQIIVRTVERGVESWAEHEYRIHLT